METTLPTLFDENSVAAWLGLSRQRVKRLVELDMIPFVRLPDGTLRFEKSALVEWFHEQPRANPGGRR